MKTEQEYRDDLVQIGKRLYSKGLVAGTNGNISIRIDTEEILTTARGVSLGALVPESILKTNITGDLIVGNGRTSVEYPLHLEVYNRRWDIRAVVHAHPPIATGMAAAGLDMVEPLLTEVVLGFGEIPLAEYAAPTREEFPRSISELAENHDAILLANHGALTIGKSLEDAFYKMEVLELVAQSTLTAKLFGGGKSLSRPQAQELRIIREMLTPKTLTPMCETCGTCKAQETGDLPPALLDPKSEVDCATCQACPAGANSLKGKVAGTRQEPASLSEVDIEQIVRQIISKWPK